MARPYKICAKILSHVVRAFVKSIHPLSTSPEDDVGSYSAEANAEHRREIAIEDLLLPLRSRLRRDERADR